MGSADDFLNLTPEAAAYIELKLSLSRSLKKRRSRENLSQVDVAKIINTSQPVLPSWKQATLPFQWIF